MAVGQPVLVLSAPRLSSITGTGQGSIWPSLQASVVQGPKYSGVLFFSAITPLGVPKGWWKQGRIPWALGQDPSNGTAIITLGDRDRWLFLELDLKCTQGGPGPNQRRRLKKLTLNHDGAWVHEI